MSRTLADAEHHEIVAPGGRIHVATVGEGPPLMLVHGWPQDHRAWRLVVPKLTDRFRLILPDLRGFGRSEAPAGDYRKAALASDLLAVLDALDPGPVGLVGHDWGGFVGFHLAVGAPERFTGFAFLNIPHPWLKVPRSPARLAAFTYMPVLATPVLGPLLMRATPLVRGLIRGGTAKENRIDDDDIAAFTRMIAEPDRARASSALYRDFLVRELPSLGRAFKGKRLELPVHVIFGKRDPAVHHSMVDGLERRCADLSHTWIEDAGHFVAEERPGPVAEALAAFFTPLT